MTTVVRKFRSSLCASGRTSQIRKFYCQRGPESNCPNAQRRGRRKFLLRRNKKAGKSPITLEAPTPLGRGGIPPVPGVRYIRWPLPCLPHGLPRGIRKLGNPPSLKLIATYETPPARAGQKDKSPLSGISKNQDRQAATEKGGFPPRHVRSICLFFFVGPLGLQE